MIDRDSPDHQASQVEGRLDGQAVPGGELHLYLALCEACLRCLSEEQYQQAEQAQGLDPACPNCGRSCWTFHQAGVTC